MLKKWPWLAGFVSLISAGIWLFGPVASHPVYRGHRFEYLEPLSESTNRSSLLRVWVGYQGRRPRWWGQKVESRIEDGHEWSFSNGPSVQGGGGIPAMAEYNAEKDCYQYDLEKGLTVYKNVNGNPVAMASGLAAQCKLKVTFRDPGSNAVHDIPMTLALSDGQEVFK